MKNFAVVVCVFGPAFSAVAAGADSLQRLVEQPVLWSTFDWSRVATNPIVSDPQWQLVKGQSEGGISVKAYSRRSLQVRGEAWTAIWQPEDDPSSGTFFASRGVSLADCEAAALEYGKQFGSPVYSDGSLRLPLTDTESTTLTHRRWEWTVGTTRINASCTDLGSTAQGSSGVPPLTFSFKSTARSVALAPSFMLRCTRVFQSAKANFEKRFEDMVFWVVPGTPRSTIKSVLNDPISQAAEVDETSIAFTQDTKGGPVRYVVSRITGSLNAEARDAKGESLGRINGSCEKTSAAAKF